MSNWYYTRDISCKNSGLTTIQLWNQNQWNKMTIYSLTQIAQGWFWRVGYDQRILMRQKKLTTTQNMKSFHCKIKLHFENTLNHMLYRSIGMTCKNTAGWTCNLDHACIELNSNSAEVKFTCSVWRCSLGLEHRCLIKAGWSTN